MIRFIEVPPTFQCPDYVEEGAFWHFEDLTQLRESKLSLGTGETLQNFKAFCHGIYFTLQISLSLSGTLSKYNRRFLFVN